jgi:hypothetical protein
MSLKESFQLDNSIQIENQLFTFWQIHRQFSQTEGGQYLATNIRWGPRKPKDMANQKWVETIGYDAHNLEHCRLMYGLTRQFIRYQNQSDLPIQFTPEEQTILLLTAITHDWPEGLTGKGDINAEAKNAQDEADELATIEKPIIDILGQNPKSIKLAASVKYCLGNIDSKLGKAFNIIESIGYLRTALISYKKSIQLKDNINLKNRLILIAHNVPSNSIIKIINSSSDYAFVQKYLLDQKDTISQIFNLDRTTFDLYDQDSCQVNSNKIPKEQKPSDFYYQKFITTKSAWSQWTQNFNNAKISY